MRLPERLRRTLEKLTRSGITEGFYLAGGTAVSLRYGHRISEDFDFFTLPDRELNPERITSLLRENARWLDISKETATFIYLPEGVKVSFFKYSYPLLEVPEFNKDLSILIASDIDIASMKAIAIAQRGSKKDFYDLWYLMQTNSWTLKDLETALKRKIPYWDFGVFLRSLTYFEDAEKESYTDIDRCWNEVKGFFKAMVKDASLIKRERGNKSL